MLDPDNNLERERFEEREGVEQREVSPDKNYEQALTGAEILENPPDGSFYHGLQVFIAWVQSLVSGKKDD